MILYSVIISIIAVLLLAKYLQYKIIAYTMTYLYVDKYREPTKEEFRYGRNKVIEKLFKIKVNTE